MRLFIDPPVNMRPRFVSVLVMSVYVRLPLCHTAESCYDGEKDGVLIARLFVPSPHDCHDRSQGCSRSCVEIHSHALPPFIKYAMADGRKS